MHILIQLRITTNKQRLLDASIQESIIYLTNELYNLMKFLISYDSI